MEHRTDELDEDGERVVGPGGQGFDEVQVVRDADVVGRVWAQGLHAHPGYGLGCGQHGVGQPGRGQLDDEVVHGAVRATLDDAKADDVDAGLTQGGRDGAQGAGTVRQDEAQQIRHVVKDAFRACQSGGNYVTCRYQCCSSGYLQAPLAGSGSHFSSRCVTSGKEFAF